MLRVAPIRSLALFLAFPCAGGAVRAGEIQVPANVPTIQAAIDLASDGDVIQVAPGIYREALDLHGKRLEVRGVAGSARTTLDASGLGTAVRMTTGEPAGTVLAGFTIRSSTLTFEQRALEVGASADVRVEDCDFRDLQYFVAECLYFVGGVAIDVQSAKLELRDCAIVDNEVDVQCSKSFLHGSAVRCRQGKISLRDCEIARNVVAGFVSDAPSTVHLEDSEALFEDSSITDNSRAALTAQFSRVTLRRCSIRRNGYVFALRTVGFPEHAFELDHVEVVDNAGVGLKVGDVSLSTVVLRHCTFANNGPLAAPKADVSFGFWNGAASFENTILWSAGIETSVSGNDVALRYCDVKAGTAGYSLDHVFSLPPGFEAPDQGDYRLAPGSPCIDSGNPQSPPDADLTLPDVGANAYQPWQVIEAGEQGSWSGTGSLAPNSEFQVALSAAPANAAFVLVVGATIEVLPLPLGSLIPQPAVLLFATTDAAGAIEFEARWPATAPSGAAIVLQSLFPAPAGAQPGGSPAPSDALRGVGR